MQGKSTDATASPGSNALGRASLAPTFSKLPLGPLATSVLFLEERDVAQLLRTSKDVCTSGMDSDEFWANRCYRSFGAHTRYVQPLGKKAFQTFLRGKRHSLDESLWGRDEWLERSDQLLHASVGISSQDQEDEDPRHTLVQSPCAEHLLGMDSVDIGFAQRLQLMCGCVNYEKCYWSSEPCAKADKDEWLEYDMVDGLAIITSFTLTPYTSFWQPDQPTYNPVEASFQLTHPDVNQGEPYYESPRYMVEGGVTAMTRHQQFDLPKPILSLGGRAKMILFGKAQRQTLGEHAGETANHYYTCISLVSLQGTLLRLCRIANDDPSSPSAKISADAAVDQANVRKTNGTTGASMPCSSTKNAHVTAGDGTRGLCLEWVGW